MVSPSRVTRIAAAAFAAALTVFSHGCSLKPITENATQVASKLSPRDCAQSVGTISKPAGVDGFGNQMALGDTLLAAATRTYDFGLQMTLGAVHIYDDDGNGGWAPRSILNSERPGDGLGISVAVADDIVAAGAIERFCTFDCNDIQGTGYVKVFEALPDRDSVIKLPPPSDLVVRDDFGLSVDISESPDGLSWNLVVGAPSQGVGGAVYLYTSTIGSASWTLEAKLTAPAHPESDPVDADFGNAVAIDGDLLVVGAYRQRYTGMANYAGAAYIYERDANIVGQWNLIQGPLRGRYGLLGQNEHFGTSVDATQDMIVIGTSAGFYTDLTPYATVMSRYGNKSHFASSPIFADGQDGRYFGANVAASGQLAMLGTDFDISAPNGQLNVFTSAQNFKGTSVSWFKLAEVPPIQKTRGFGMALHDNRIVLAEEDPIENYAQMLSVHTIADSDEDGLYDCWESGGLDYNGDGIVDLDLPALGADPLHKDLFVEVDLVAGLERAPIAAALEKVRAAFATAPVDNPDSLPGINLHAEISNDNLPAIPGGWTLPNGPGTWPPEFEELKGDYFPTLSHSLASLPTRSAYYLTHRYCIFTDEPGTTGLWGQGELSGNDFFVATGPIYRDGGGEEAKVDNLARTFMHELGHNLSLSHGGGDEINGKPNYVSVMNYGHLLAVAAGHPQTPLDYSRETLDTLFEGALDETVGVTFSTWNSDAFMPFGVPKAGGGRDIHFVQLDGSPVDWNGNGVIDSALVSADPSNLGKSSFGASPDQTLEGHHDWAAIRLGIGRGPKWGPEFSPDDPAELTEAEREEIEAHFAPVSGCGNGVSEPAAPYYEECDADDLTGQTCQALGFDDGILSCDSSCNFDTSQCTMDPCVADGDGLGCSGSTNCCSGAGNCTGGKPSRRVCEAAPGPEPVCGDGVREAPESCDGTDLGGADCISMGFTDGSLTCNASCLFDTSSCTGAACFAAGTGLGCKSSTACCSGAGNCTGGKPSKRVCR